MVSLLQAGHFVTDAVQAVRSSLVGPQIPTECQWSWNAIPQCGQSIVHLCDAVGASSSNQNTVSTSLAAVPAAHPHSVARCALTNITIFAAVRCSANAPM